MTLRESQLVAASKDFSADPNDNTLLVLKEMAVNWTISVTKPQANRMNEAGAAELLNTLGIESPTNAKLLLTMSWFNSRVNYDK